MFIEIDKVRYVCNVETCTSQKGNTVVRVISADAPVATNGFILYTDDEETSFDRSDYKYLYREDGDTKEYTSVEEEPIPTQGYTTGVPVNPIVQQFSAINRKIADITPYTESRTVYIGEKECRFEKRDGNISAFLSVGGLQKPCTVQTDEAYIIVSFDELEEVGTVTISIQ